MYLLEQHSNSLKVWSAIIRINTESKSLNMKWGTLFHTVLSMFIFQEELLTSCIPKDLMNAMKEDLTRKMMSKVPRITPFHDLYVKHHSNVR